MDDFRLKHTIKGKWAKIVIETNLNGLHLIIQDAYDNAVRELNLKEVLEEDCGVHL